MYVPEFDPEKSGAIAVGIDVIEIERIKRVLGEFGQQFLDRVYTPAEQQRYSRFPNELAGRFAASDPRRWDLQTAARPCRWEVRSPVIR